MPHQALHSSRENPASILSPVQWASTHPRIIRDLFPGIAGSAGQDFLPLEAVGISGFRSFLVEPINEAAQKLEFSKIIFVGHQDGDSQKQDLTSFGACSQSSKTSDNEDPHLALTGPLFKKNISIKGNDKPWWRIDFPSQVTVDNIYLYGTPTVRREKVTGLRLVGIDTDGERYILAQSETQQNVAQITMTAFRVLDQLAKQVKDNFEDFQHARNGAAQALSEALNGKSEINDTIPGGKARLRRSIAAQLMDALSICIPHKSTFGWTPETGLCAQFPQQISQYVRIRILGGGCQQLGGFQLFNHQKPDQCHQWGESELRFKFKPGGFVSPHLFALGLHNRAHARIIDLNSPETFNGLRLWNSNQKEANNTQFLDVSVSNDRQKWETIYRHGGLFQVAHDVLKLIDLLMPSNWLPKYVHLRARLYGLYNRTAHQDALIALTDDRPELKKACQDGLKRSSGQSLQKTPQTTPGPNKLQPPTVLFNSPDFKVTGIMGSGNEVCLSFLGVGEGFGGVAVQKEEFLGTASAGGQRTVLFIFDKKRHWFSNHKKNTRLFEFLNEFCRERKFTKHIALGNSMGGFGALIATRYMQLDRVLSFCPQYSVDPTLVPEETRWKEWTETIPNFDIQTVANGCFDHGDIYVVHGENGEDKVHYQRFPRHANIHHFIVPKADHTVARKLKGMGILSTMIGMCFSQKPHEVEKFMTDHKIQRRDR